VLFFHNHLMTLEELVCSGYVGFLCARVLTCMLTWLVVLSASCAHVCLEWGHCNGAAACIILWAKGSSGAVWSKAHAGVSPFLVVVCNRTCRCMWRGSLHQLLWLLVVMWASLVKHRRFCTSPLRTDGVEAVCRCTAGTGLWLRPVPHMMFHELPEAYCVKTCEITFGLCRLKRTGEV